MKGKTTLALLLVAIAVGLYVKFYESKRPNTAEAKRQAQNVVNFKKENIDGIVIQNGDDKIELRRSDAKPPKWRMEAPIKDQADASAIENLLADLDGWQREETIPAKEIEADKNRMTEYGLSKAKLRLKLLGKDAPPEILFGSDAALEGKMYVRLENSKDAIIAAQSVRNGIAKKPDDFRDKKLTDLATAQVTRVIVKIPAGEMELQKNNEHWEIVKPLRARADDGKVGDLIAQITTAQVQQFVGDDRGDLHPAGLSEPRGAITLFAQGDNQGQVFQIGGVPEKEKVYVRSVARGSVYTLPKKIEAVLNTTPADLRDRHLVRIDTNNLDRVTIDAAGKGKTVLARKDESWTIASRNNQPANAQEVNRLLEALRNEQVTKFVEDVGSDLAKYGLDKPQLQITFSSFASENTAESTAGEHPFASVAFGRVEGDNVFARVGEEPFIVAVRRVFLESIFVDPVQWQELAIFKFKPDEVHRLSVWTDRERSLVRGPGNSWTPVNATEPVDTVHVQSLVNTLTALHAVGWVSGAPVPQGFDKPQLTITFTTSPDDKAAHKLIVGGPTGDGMWFAKVEGRDGVFVMNNPDFNALRLSLFAMPATPTPAGTPVTPTTTPSPTPAAPPPTTP